MRRCYILKYAQEFVEGVKEVIVKQKCRVTSADGDTCVKLTNDTFSEWGTFERGQAQVSYLDGARGAGDEDVVTFEVPVDDGRSARMQEVKPLEDLTTPALQQLQLHLLEPLQVPETKEDGAEYASSKQAVKMLEEEPQSCSSPTLAAKRTI